VTIVLYPEFDRLLTFVSVHHSLRAEQALAAAGIRTVAVPTPREIALSCGQALLYASADDAAVLAILAGAGIKWSGLYRREAPGGWELLRTAGNI